MSGIAYAPFAEARIQIRQAAMDLGITVRPQYAIHRDPRYVQLSRGHSQHITDGEVCNCMAGVNRQRCWAVKLVESVGGVRTFRVALRMETPETSEERHARLERDRDMDFPQ